MIIFGKSTKTRSLFLSKSKEPICKHKTTSLVLIWDGGGRKKHKSLGFVLNYDGDDPERRTIDRSGRRMPA